MKKLVGLIWLVMTVLTFSQHVKYLTAGDTLYVYPDIQKKHKYVFFSVLDSADSKVDTLIVERRESGSDTYYPVGLYLPLANDYDDDGIIVPGDDTFTDYMINEPYPGAVRIRKTNYQSYTTARVRIQWSGRQ